MSGTGDSQHGSGGTETGAGAAQPFRLTSGVTRVATCDLRVAPGRWAWADANASAVDAHWQRRRVEQPKLFNGVIYLVSAAAVVGDRLVATFLATEFKCYLYWRETGFPEAGVRDGFGAALLRSAEGHLLYGRQRPGNGNGGLVYPPSGFIDGQDVGTDGRIDIGASIAREVAEETGLTPPVGDGAYWIAVTCPHVAIAREFGFSRPAAELAAEIDRRLAADPASELAEMVVLAGADDLEASAPAHGRLLAKAVLAARHPEHTSGRNEGRA